MSDSFIRRAATALLALAKSSMDWVRHRRESVRRVALVFALILFVGGFCLALFEVPDILDRLRFGPLLLLLIVGPIVTILHAATEFWLTAKSVGTRIRWRVALEVTILASAANMLPLPGGVLTRVAALTGHGAPVGRSSMAIFLFAFIWGGMSFVYSGVALIFHAYDKIGGIFCLVGFVMLCVSTVGFWRLRTPLLPPVISACIRLISLPLEAVRLMLAAWSVGASIDFGQSSVLVVASFLGLATSLIPAGLGFREAVMAALAPAISMSPALGFLTGIVGRLVYMVGQGIAASLVLCFPAKRADKPKLENPGTSYSGTE